MCDVCKLEGIDFLHVNGKKDRMSHAKLYRVYVGQVAKVLLCHIHDIQLFSLGEGRFLHEHISLAQALSEKKASFISG